LLIYIQDLDVSYNKNREKTLISCADLNLQECILINSTVIINNEVIQHCKKNNTSLLNIHPGYIDNIGRFPLIKSLKTNNYGIFCHEVSSIIDDTRNILYKYNIETQNNQAGLDFIKTKTEYIISQIGRFQ
jgi:hypothetical protein